MSQTNLSQVLRACTELPTRQVDIKDPAVAKMIEVTKEQQDATLRLKIVDRESLKAVITL